MDNNLSIVYNEITKLEPAIKAAMGSSELATSFARSLQTAVRKNTNIANCDLTSIRQCAMDLAQVKLEPNTPMQLAALIPYGRELKYQIMTQGLVELIYRAGKVDWVKAVCVFKGEHYVEHQGTEQKLEHIPDPDNKHNPDDIVGGYAIAQIKGASKPVFITMNIHELNKIRLRSAGVKSGKASPWDTDPEEMYKKTLLKRLTKILPKSKELAQAVEYDNHQEGGIRHSTIIEGDKVIDIPQDTNQGPSNEQKVAENVKSKMTAVTVKPVTPKAPTREGLLEKLNGLLKMKNIDGQKFKEPFENEYMFMEFDEEASIEVLNKAIIKATNQK